MENRKQKFEKLYKQYTELVAKREGQVQDFRKEKDVDIDKAGDKSFSLKDEIEKLAKELKDKYSDFLENLPSSEKIYKDHLKKDCEDSKKDI